VLLLVLIIGSSEENFDHDQEHEHEKSKQTTFESISSLVVSVGSERQDLLCL
jgi:hypothetical protein